MQETKQPARKINWLALVFIILLSILVVSAYAYRSVWQDVFVKKVPPPAPHQTPTLKEEPTPTSTDQQVPAEGPTPDPNPPVSQQGHTENISSIKNAYFLTRMAEDRLQQHDVPTAKQLLQLAQEQLVALQVPGIKNARAILEADSTALSTTQLPNLLSLQQKLGTLDVMVNTLPSKVHDQRQAAQDNKAHKKNKDKLDESTLQKSINELVTEFKNVVKVRKKNDVELKRVHQDQDLIQFKFLIEQTRWAVFYQDANAYKQSLVAMQQLLIRDFDPNDANVQQFTATITELAAINLNPAIPSLQNSINALQALLVG